MKLFILKVYIIMLVVFGVFSFIIEDRIISDDAKKLTGFKKDPKFHDMTYKETITYFKTGVHEFSSAWEFEIIGVMFFLLDPVFTFYGSFFYLCTETYKFFDKGHEYGGLNDLLYAILTNDNESLLKIGELPKETYLENRVPLPERLTEEEKLLRLEQEELARKKAEKEKLVKMYFEDQNDSSFAREAKEREVVRKRTGYRGNPGNRSN